MGQLVAGFFFGVSHGSYITALVGSWRGNEGVECREVEETLKWLHIFSNRNDISAACSDTKGLMDWRRAI
jgi:hypothetical protein